jgi:hypothetical protein
MRSDTPSPLPTRPRHRGLPMLRRGVFWAALVVMLASAVVGLIWRLLDGKWSVGPQVAASIGSGALLIALVFGLLHFTNPTFHPESHLFGWSDVDALRALARNPAVTPEQREWARSLADRIAIVLPGRVSPPEPRKPSKTNV